MASRERQECQRILEIREEFRSLVPPLTLEEYNQLEAMLLNEGCRDALVVWQGILLDGHNRLRICEKHGLPYKTATLEFEDENDAQEWIIRNQFGRRNLAPSQRCKLALLLKPVIQEQAKAKQREAGGAVRQKSDKPPIDTKKELAKIAGVSHDTIHKVKQIINEGSKDISDKVKSGKWTINKAA